MGDIADDMINGDIDEQTGEWLGGGSGFPRTKERGFYNSMGSSKRTKSIRAELYHLIQAKQIDCITEKEKNRAVNNARQEINIKYGKDWRGI